MTDLLKALKLATLAVLFVAFLPVMLVCLAVNGVLGLDSASTQGAHGLEKDAERRWLVHYAAKGHTVTAADLR